MSNKKFKHTVAMGFLWFAAILFCLPLFGQNLNSELTENDKLSLITRLVSRIIAKNHYRQHPLNDTISAQIFDDYFKRLDGNKTFFTAKDIQKFKPYSLLLDDMIEKGNFQFAFEVYDLFLKRFSEYRAFSEKLLDDGFDFTVDEEFVMDRRNLPPPENLQELHEIWRKKLKNDVLTFRLMARAQKEIDEENLKKNPKAVVIKMESPEEKIRRRLRDVYNSLSQRDRFDILSEFLSCVSQTYGPHSSYFSPREEEDFNISMSLSLEGIGATLSSEDGYTKVVQLVPGGPAAKDGRLQADDKIIAVAQEGEPPVDIIDMSVSNVVKLIRGKENTKVILSVLKKSGGGVPENIELTRAKVELKESEASGVVKMIATPDGKEFKAGVITLPRFYIDFKGAAEGNPNYKSSTRDIKKILEKFATAKVDGVIMDLRFNGGGSLAEAISLTGLFIKDGPIVQVRAYNRNVAVKNDPDSNIDYAGPLVVLTNKMTSSAAEIFTGAIKDYKRGIVIGDTRTYGKGTVLEVVELGSLLRYVNQEFPAGSLKFESAVFYRVNGSSTQALGVTPDVVLPSLTEHMEIGEMYSDNHLPWDAIDAVKHEIFEPELDKFIPELKKLSSARIAKSEDFRKIQDRIELYRKYKDRKSVSLNEKARWVEYQQEKKANEAQELVYGEMEEKNNVKVEEPAKIDPVIKEAVFVLSDLMRLKLSAQ